MEWTGIDNENEFYSAYFFSEGLMNALGDRLKKWGDEEGRAKEEAQTQGLSTWKRSPASALRLACSKLAEAIDDLPRSSGADRLDAERQINGRLLSIFGLPNYSQENGTLRFDPFFPNGADKPPVALIGSLYADGKPDEPVLWVLEASSLGQSDADEKDPLEWKLSRDQFASLPALPKQAQDMIDEQTWAQVLQKNVFGSDNPPRWVILAAGPSWVLIDRTKWCKNSCLRFDWREIAGRRTPDVLNGCAALLSADAMIGSGGRVLLDTVDEEAHKQAYGVSETLKRSLREAIELLGNEAAGQLADMNVPQKDLADILTRECLRYMYRILFLLFVESRKELNYAPVDNPAYATAYSFESLRDLEMIPLMTEEDMNGHYIDDSIKKLFRFFEKGTPNGEVTAGFNSFGAAGFSISPLRGTLFDSTKTPYLNRVVFTNKTLQQVVRLMSLSRGSAGKGRRSERTGRISYAHLGINQLGAVYEALLSYRGFFAKTDLYEVRPKDSKADEFDTGYFVTAAELDDDKYDEGEKVFVTNADGEKMLKCYPKGTFIYRLTGREREKTASYYTPEVLTKCVVKYALKEYFETVIDKLGSDKEKAEKILSLRICEPAMGSAAFLNEAINQLAVHYMEFAQKAKGERLSLEIYGKELQRVKMYLADNCVFGVDLNPVAVELAEVSLWLNALSYDKFVPWFNLQLNVGNSLIGCRRTVYEQNELIGSSGAPGIPRDIGGQKLSDKLVWQFLVPDKAMSDYKDKDIKALFPTQVEALSKRRKGLLRKITLNDAALMAQLSQKAERLWQSYAKKLAEFRAEATDPYPIYGHESQKHKSILSYQDKNDRMLVLQEGDGSEKSGEFIRLKTAMNYWCALWFWPIEKATLFPTLDEFLADMGMLLSSEVFNTDQDIEFIQTDLFTSYQSAVTERKAEEDSYGRLNVKQLRQLYPVLDVTESLADRYKFFHWPLEFADFFVGNSNQLGFDLTFGNPPWRVPTWNSGAVIGDFIPYVLFRKESASTLQKRLLAQDSNGKRLFDRRPDIASAWIEEYEEADGLKRFINANYPLLEGCRLDLFKVFLPLAWRNSARDGIQGFLHPLSSINETKSIVLRSASYRRLRYLFKFHNEEKLFDIGNRNKFAIAVYGKEKNDISFKVIMGLFHPRTIDSTFESTDSSLSDGLKTADGKWNHKGTKDRLITINEKSLEAIGKIFGESQKTPVMPDIYSQSLLQVMMVFSKLPLRLRDLGTKNYSISSMWNETTARLDGTIAEFPNHLTQAPKSLNLVILNGPHLFVGNPFFQAPNNPCTSHRDWLSIDLELMPSNFIPRCKYERACDEATYAERQVKCEWDDKPFDQHWRLTYREMVGTDSERTLTSAIYPRGVSCVNTINMIATKSRAVLLTLASSFASIPIDAYVRLLGKGHLLPDLISGLPLVEYSARQNAAFIRCLGLNCLTKPYIEFWNSSFQNDFKSDSWTTILPQIKQDWFKSLTSEWSRTCGLRSDLMRRQALIELDVLTAQAMGFSLNDLLTLYRLKFRVLRDYEADTWYDQNGRIVFTTNKSLASVGLPRKKRSTDAEEGITYRRNGYDIDGGGLGFEDIKAMTSGYVEKIFPDMSITDEPVMTTVKYVAPFFQMDREADYKRAWAVFEERYGKI